VEPVREYSDTICVRALFINHVLDVIIALDAGQIKRGRTSVVPSFKG